MEPLINLMKEKLAGPNWLLEIAKRVRIKFAAKAIIVSNTKINNFQKCIIIFAFSYFLKKLQLFHLFLPRVLFNYNQLGIFINLKYLTQVKI